MQQLWVQSLVQEYPSEKEMATLQYSCQANPTERGLVGGYSPWGRKRLGHDLVTKQQQSRQQTDPSYSTDTEPNNIMV